MSADSINYLNLDEVAPVKRKIAYKGNEYEVKVLTVNEFIEMNKSVDQAKDTNEMSTVEQVEFLIDQIIQAVPDFPEAELKAMNFDMLMMIIDFLKGVHEEQIRESDEGKKL